MAKPPVPSSPPKIGHFCWCFFLGIHSSAHNNVARTWWHCVTRAISVFHGLPQQHFSSFPHVVVVCIFFQQSECRCGPRGCGNNFFSRNGSSTGMTSVLYFGFLIGWLSILVLNDSLALSLPPRELKYDYAYIVDQPAPSVAFIENSRDTHVAPSTFNGTHPLKEDDIFMFLHIPVRMYQPVHRSC